MAKMGLQFGLESQDVCFKRKYRWLFRIPDVSAEQGALPPSKAARPNLSFRETQVEHLTETVFLPGKPDWKPVTVTLFDVIKGRSVPFEWLVELYDPRSGSWVPPGGSKFFKECTLDLYNGCGDSLESWTFETVWPQQVDFADLSMEDSAIVTVDLTLRYARAYTTS